MEDASPEANGGDPALLAMIKALKDEMKAMKNQHHMEAGVDSSSTEPLEDS
ncbi:hypothetical protein A2U01_0094857, partial [Trifolium medium]|nr:hypothetical protein [Trifolium medium]